MKIDLDKMELVDRSTLVRLEPAEGQISMTIVRSGQMYWQFAGDTEWWPLANDTSRLELYTAHSIIVRSDENWMLYRPDGMPMTFDSQEQTFTVPMDRIKIDPNVALMQQIIRQQADAFAREMEVTRREIANLRTASQAVGNTPSVVDGSSGDGGQPDDKDGGGS